MFSSRSGSPDYYPAQVFGEDIFFYSKSSESFVVDFKSKDFLLLPIDKMFVREDFDFFLMDDSDWAKPNSKCNQGQKVDCFKVFIDSSKPWTLPIIGYLNGEKFAYINEFYIQKKNTAPPSDLFYDSFTYTKKFTPTFTMCLATNNENNCTVLAINSFFNEDGKPHEQRFTLDDWKKGLNSSIMSLGIFAKAQQLSIVYKNRKHKKVVDLR